MGSLQQRVWLLTPGGCRTLCGDWPPDASQPCFQSFGVRGRGPVLVSVRQASRHVLEMQRPGAVVRGAAAGPSGCARGPGGGHCPCRRGCGQRQPGCPGSPSLGSGRGGSRSGEQSSRQGTPTPDALFLGAPPPPLVGRGPGQLSVDRLRASVLEGPARGCTLASGWAEAVLTYIS